MKIFGAAFLITLLFPVFGFAQKTGKISGTVTDKADKSTLIGVTVALKGTSFGTVTDIDGNYSLPNIPSGTYMIECSYVGYEKILITGIKIADGEQKKVDVQMGVSAITLDDNIVVIGEKPLVDVEDSKSTQTIGKDQIESAPTRQIQGIINTSAGVVQNAEGIHIRGGRTYETGFFIDEVSATDPLAGTGFGIDLGSNAIDDIEVSTSSSSVEYGNSTSGTVNAKTKSGGQKFALNASAKKDNLGFNNDWNSTFNNSVYELGMGGPFKFKKTVTPKFKYFTSFKFNFTDNYFKQPANQVTSSVYPDTFWSPMEDNRWAGMLKLNYDFSSAKKLSFTYLKSLTINQDFNMLRITGNDVGFTPGYQYNFELQPDNANSYTHDTNLESLVWIQTPKPSFSYRVTVSRLFVHLRADANGRDWRPQQVNSEFDPASIVTFPTQYFNPTDSIVFVLPGPGLFNNDGIATLWHDHYVEEYSLKSSATFYSKNTGNRFYIGGEWKRREMQWIDITRPWIGAPIQLPDGNYTQSFRLGDLSDAWHVVPVRGAFYVSDKYKFRGLIADIGLRYEYWFAGKFVDDAITNPDAPIADAIRDEYKKHTVSIFGSRMKMRLLPKLAASFPIKENQVMYFNYGHSMVEPHPSYIYTGLDPYYADRSTLARIGNPDLNPEVDISYELGLKSQLGN
ncbi:MAG: carboxypeptidase-like regulatory domain-containing protein, partial [Bacteroidota bacterium]